MVKTAVLVILVLALLACGFLAYESWASRSFTLDLGPRDGRLAPCNLEARTCVSSFETDAIHRVEPFVVSDDLDRSFERLVAAIESMENARIVRRDPDYLHATFTSSFFRFIDDLEILADSGTGVIHVRSASRVGRYDFGVNRARVEELRRLYENAP